MSVKQTNPNPQFYQPAILPQALAAMYETLANAPTPEARATAATAIIKEYHSCFGADGMRKDMWLLLAAAMSNSETEILNSGADRHNLLFFYEFTLMLLDAVYVVCGEEEFGRLVGGGE